MDEKTLHTTIALATAFTAVTMTANIMSLRMVAPLGICMDAGALLYPLTFVIRNLIHKHAGLKAANRAVLTSVICNIFMFGMFYLVSVLPPDPRTGEQAEFAMVLLPGFLIVGGSIVAQLISERIDGRIFESIYRGGQGKLIKAMLVSNLICIPIDTIIMCSIAFGFTVPFETLVFDIFTNIAIKYAVMIVSTLLCALKMKE